VADDIDQLEIVQLLLQLGDLKHLGNVALLDLAQTAQIESLAKGELISAEQQRNRHVYLISGEIALSASGKNMQHISGGSERALLPLFRVHTHGLMAKCLSPVRLLSLNEETVHRYVASIKPREMSGIRVEEYTEIEQQASIIGDIRRIFYHKEVDLPSLPEVALRVNRALHDPHQDLHGLAIEIQADPMIAARVIQVANSALYNPPQFIESIQVAVSCIGLKALQAIVLSVVLRNLFKPKSPLVHKRALSFYSHSIRVGAICYILGRYLNDFDQEHAFLAGLLHDIGVMPLLILADERSDLSTNPDLLETIIHNLVGTVGGLLLRQWGFAEDLQTVAQEAQEWKRQRDTADYCYLVGGHKQDAPPLNELPAFTRLHLNTIDPVAVIHEARNEILEIVNMLMH
jgi:HD-like signal output (HDOD) protein